MKIVELAFKYDPKRFLAFVLSDSTVKMLRELYPPQFPRVITHHVTMAFDQTSFEGVVNAMNLSDLNVEALALVEGKLNGKGIECFLVSVDDRVGRIGLPGKYHITHSLTPPLKPVNSNDLLYSKSAKYYYFDRPLKLHGKAEQVKL